MTSSATIDTGTPDLLATSERGILTLTLNRPDARNAMTSAMIVALGDQLARAETDEAVRCIVLTGAGKGFCAGGDVKSMAEADEASRPTAEKTIHLQKLAQRATAGKLFSIPKPTIASINGAAAGAGFALALACDLRIMATGAVLTSAFGRVGLPGDFGGSYFLTQLVGVAKARELYFLSDRVDAEQALQLVSCLSIATQELKWLRLWSSCCVLA